MTEELNDAYRAINRINERLRLMEKENTALRKQLGENTQLVRALEERQNESSAMLAKMQSEGKLDFLDAMELPKQSKRYEKIYVSRKMAKSLAKVAPATKASKRR